MNKLKNADEIQQALGRMAEEIASGDSSPLIVGIHTNGVPLAKRLGEKIGSECEFGTIDITLYRDDLDARSLPKIKGSDIPQSLDGRRVVLVDDVLFTGRTIRAALAVLADYGRPSRVELAVLVDRGHRELPISADYVGFKVETLRRQKVRVVLSETGAKEDLIVIEE
ncbi:MAG: bifunctional pyr operon transcriptional regulator/uracil phosphoribosyltransferase PyrR [Planctomycetes bacterium]|nr:bifunctional pyr operon transcriptional regulator/uracil phosphoribosyltransferase PyrR [Planctomycetota bacterium]